MAIVKLSETMGFDLVEFYGAPAYKGHVAPYIHLKLKYMGSNSGMKHMLV